VCVSGRLLSLIASSKKYDTAAEFGFIMHSRNRSSFCCILLYEMDSDEDNQLVDVYDLYMRGER